MLLPLFAYCTAMCVLCFCLFGSDKRRAKRHARRIPEKSLIALSFLGGGLGSWLGMHIFRHKTLHASFRIIIPLSAAIWCIIIAVSFLAGHLDTLSVI